MPTAPGYATCSYKLKHSALNRPAYLTFGIDPTGTDAQAVASQVAQAFGQTGSLFSCIDSNVTMVETRVSLGVDGAEDVVGVDGNTKVCTRSLSSLPPNCAMLVTKVTARGGRRGRGRMYIPWSINAPLVTEAGGFDGADKTAVTNAVGIWSTALSSLAGPLVVLHKPSKPGTAHPTVPGAPNVVTGFLVDSLVATQRRRIGR